MNQIKKNIKSTLIRNIMKFYYYFYGVDNNKIVFKSFSNQYSCNPKAISEKLHEISPDKKIYWIFDDLEKVSGDIPEYIHKVKGKTTKKLKELATARVWVDNCTKIESTWKGRKNFYIQTWHGDKAFKKIGFDAGKISKEFEKKAPKFDLAIAGSTYGERKYRNGFRFEGEILNIGTPRNDILLNYDNKIVKKIKQKLNIGDDCKILLYAPTFRDSQAEKQQEFYGLNIEETIKKLENKFNEKWICLLRTHYLVKSGFSSSNNENDNCIDVSEYDDIADLMIIADMMITDYSSCAGDFVLTKKPLILYHGDVENYNKNSRSFYFDIKDSPYYVARNQKELNEIIDNKSLDDYSENCNEILKFYGSTESGKSSEIIVERILKEMNNDV